MASLIYIISVTVGANNVQCDDCRLKTLGEEMGVALAYFTLANCLGNTGQRIVKPMLVIVRIVCTLRHRL